MSSGEGWKLIDLELAVQMKTNSENEYRGNQGVGTLHYLAPEWPKVISTKADIWALGVTLHVICTECFVRGLSEVPNSEITWRNASMLQTNRFASNKSTSQSNPSSTQPTQKQANLSPTLELCTTCFA
jgi:serine/threonine protein kinase